MIRHFMNDQWWGGVIVRGRGLDVLVRGAAFSPGRYRQGFEERHGRGARAERHGWMGTGRRAREEGQGISRPREWGRQMPGKLEIC
ncbi:hypothetical protein HMPREF0551_1974 [Lautropia mirabilis ATCC 51599]|uniref:Uncharacterized protein n=1 Tax=Lautropia mirabilis ATCC 51599 TaxID=887898 RepID=E7RZ60_9BURK|nr:hypothetical protein HMPREF0551_1974 [Lautropia mirabilis ATCC 51599]